MESSLNLNSCTLCPIECGANRAEGKAGLCHADGEIKIARAALHMWEEPCLSGDAGSGTVFFSGCTMGCVFCQNREISSGRVGKAVTITRLSEIFLELQQKGAKNINLVTPTPYTLQIIDAVKLAGKSGMRLPIVYNTSGYEKVETLRLLERIVDIFLPDFKYLNDFNAKKYSNTANYSTYAMQAIDEMVRQQGECRFDDEGYMTNGVIVRHLLLPSCLEDSKDILRYLYEKYGDKIYFSIMSQYTPFGELDNFPELKKPVGKADYGELLDFAMDLGIENAFIQEGTAASESFIPPFNLEGV